MFEVIDTHTCHARCIIHAISMYITMARTSQLTMKSYKPFFPLKSKISLSLFLVLYLSRFLQQRLMRTCLISKKKNVATRYANIHPRYENISRDRSAEEQYLHESVERIQLRIERKFSWSAGNSFRGGGEEEGRESYSLVF